MLGEKKFGVPILGKGGERKDLQIPHHYLTLLDLADDREGEGGR